MNGMNRFLAAASATMKTIASLLILAIAAAGCATRRSTPIDLSGVASERELDKYVGLRVSFPGRVEWRDTCGKGWPIDRQHWITNGSVRVSPGKVSLPEPKQITAVGVLQRRSGYSPVEPTKRSATEARMTKAWKRQRDRFEGLLLQDPNSEEAIDGLRKLYESLQNAGKLRRRPQENPPPYNYVIVALPK